ncbi:glycoside hydrolase family 39 protein [Xylariaceae sp. FL0804]|nr:glycoside hydrolase family 39 protein [Xylariaceae sp. FL0804]
MTFLLCVALLLQPSLARQVNISVDASRIVGDLPPTARFFGADEPNYSTYPDGRALLHDLGHLGGGGPQQHQTYFRTHNLLTTCDPANDTRPHRLKWGCTNVYHTEDGGGEPVYDFAILDDIFDAYLASGVRPYAQAGFMPRALSTHPDPYTFYFNASDPSAVGEIYTGWSNPPTSWERWGELIYRWVRHCVDRYGEAEVETWYWEVWNEPNIAYWNGTQEQYFALYDHAVAGVRRALPGATVGGPEVAGGAGGDWLGLFLDHITNGVNYATGGRGAPLDFVSFHAKGAPTYVVDHNANTSSGDGGGYLQMNMSAQLSAVDAAFRVIRNYTSSSPSSSLALPPGLPVVIGEDNPDSCAACLSPAVAYRNGLVYPSYTAAVLARELDLAVRHGVNLTCALTWAFEYDDHPLFDGFRVLATDGIGKPILNVFRMLARLQDGGGRRRLAAISTGQYPVEAVLAGSVRGLSDVGVLASVDDDDGGGKVAVLVWNYHDDALPKPDAHVVLDITGAFLGANSSSSSSTVKEEANLTHYRIDDGHSNAYATWLAMGSPQDPTAQQYAALKASGMLQMLHPATTISLDRGCAQVEFDLPIHAVSLLLIER